MNTNGLRPIDVPEQTFRVRAANGDVLDAVTAATPAEALEQAISRHGEGVYLTRSTVTRSPVTWTKDAVSLHRVARPRRVRRAVKP